MSIYHHFLTLKAVLRREWILRKRYKVRLFTNIIEPLLWVSLFVFFGKAFIGPSGDEEIFTSYIIIGIVMLMMISTTLWSSGLVLRREQMYGTLESLFISPANKIMVIIGTAFFDFLDLSWYVGLALAFGHFAFGFSVNVADPLAVILMLVLTMVSLYGFAILFAGITLLVKESFALVNLIQPIMYLFCGIFFPVYALPSYLQWVSWMIPITYSVMGMELTVVFGATVWDVLVFYFALIVSTVVYIIIAVIVYKYIENLAKSKGVAQTF